MKFCNRSLVLTVVPAIALLMATRSRAEQWTPPTDEELKMTAQPEVPGAAAVYLFREEITDDHLHTWSKYVRIKVLTERGKEFANVEIHQYDAGDRGGYTVADIQGRTIHPDGTIIPFTGKPYQKVVEKSQGYKETAKVFTLPDVEVGSIIEYRYNLRYDDDRLFPPQWFVQSDLYTRKAHYLWKPTDDLSNVTTKNARGEQAVATLAWTPILPKEFAVKQTDMPTGQTLLELNVHDIAPLPDEEHMPPLRGLSYRVMFYYSAYKTEAEYWKNEGKAWSKELDKFIGPDTKVREAVAGLVAPTDTDDQKLRKIYAAVMKLENTDDSRHRSAAEEKSEGLGPAKSAEDIWERKRGSSDEIAQLFVAMTRAAGLKAYVMAVTDRDHDVFNPGYLSFDQLDSLLAVVNVGGKEQFFDPGDRYEPYGHLAWQHSLTSGLRQQENGTAQAMTPDEPYTSSRTQRIADLKVDDQGETAGPVSISWTGAPALHWRTQFLRGDLTSLERDLHDWLEKLLPPGMDIQVGAISNLEDYEQPLKVTFTVKGTVGSSTGKRLVLPGDIFVANAKPVFPHEKRENAVAFDYAEVMQDATRYTFPASLSVESAPANQKIPFGEFAAYSFSSQTTPTTVTVQRTFELGNLFYKVDEYPQLRDFYNKFEAKDQEPTVLKLTSSAQAKPGL